MEKITEIEDFETEAIERLEAFVESMTDDRRFTIPVEEYDDGPVEEGWSHVFTGRASFLIERMIDRLYRLAGLKFGEKAAFDMDISSCLYQEM